MHVVTKFEITTKNAIAKLDSNGWNAQLVGKNDTVQTGAHDPSAFLQFEQKQNRLLDMIVNKEIHTPWALFFHVRAIHLVDHKKQILLRIFRYILGSSS